MPLIAIKNACESDLLGISGQTCNAVRRGTKKRKQASSDVQPGTEEKRTEWLARTYKLLRRECSTRQQQGIVNLKVPGGSGKTCSDEGCRIDALPVHGLVTPHE